MRATIAILFLLTATNMASAQGLRESVVEFLDAIEASADMCVLRPALEGWVEAVRASGAARYMPEEFTQLQALHLDLTTSCLAPPDENAELEALVDRCRELGQARAFCLFRDECETVRDHNEEMVAFWRVSQSACIEPL